MTARRIPNEVEVLTSMLPFKAHARMHLAIMSLLLQMPPDQFISARNIQAGIDGSRNPDKVGKTISSSRLRAFIESRKGHGGGHRLKPAARIAIARKGIGP